MHLRLSAIEPVSALPQRGKQSEGCGGYQIGDGAVHLHDVFLLWRFELCVVSKECKP